MKRFFFITGCILLTISEPALAAVSGAELLKRCTAAEKSVQGDKLSSEELLDSTWCAAYISGLLDGFSVSDFRVGEEKMVCPPEAGLTRSQALGIITRHLREHPDDHAKTGRRSALLALAKAMPCK